MSMIPFVAGLSSFNGDFSLKSCSLFVPRKMIPAPWLPGQIWPWDGAKRSRLPWPIGTESPVKHLRGWRGRHSSPMNQFSLGKVWQVGGKMISFFLKWAKALRAALDQESVMQRQTFSCMPGTEVIVGSVSPKNWFENAKGSRRWFGAASFFQSSISNHDFWRFACQTSRRSGSSIVLAQTRHERHPTLYLKRSGCTKCPYYSNPNGKGACEKNLAWAN